MAYQTEPVPMTLSDIHCHLSIASLFRYGFMHVCSNWPLAVVLYMEMTFLQTKLTRFQGRAAADGTQRRVSVKP